MNHRMANMRTFCQVTSEPGLSMQCSSTTTLAAMPFPERLTQLRKAKGLTRQALADAIGLHLSQLKRYEAGTSQPTLEVLRKLAVVLSVSADVLLFDQDERGPRDNLKLQFEAIATFSSKEQQVARAVLDAMIVKHQVAGALERVNKPAAKEKKRTSQPPR
jgi:transcriptional regulator with XRE-family HTH domain